MKTKTQAGNRKLWRSTIDAAAKKRADGASTVTLSQIRQDAFSVVSGWFNPNTGAGDRTRDKINGLQWGGGVRMEVELLQSLFAYNDLSRTIVSALPEWGLRHGWTLKLRATDADSPLPPSMQSAELRMKVEDELARLEAHTHQRSAAIWGQLEGGGLLLLGLADGSTSENPLNLGKLDRIDWLRSVERSDIRIVSFEGDPNSGRFGQPVLFEIRQNVSAQSAASSQGGFEVEMWHWSRVVMYPGATTPRDLKIRNEGFDHSVLDHVIGAIKRTDGIWDNVGAMVADGSQGVWKIKGLFQAVVSGNRDQIESRFSIADQARSMFRSILLDADQEEFSYVSREFGGISDLLGQSAVRTAAAAQMPVTVLYGQSPAGMNATGESDIRLWYDRVEQYQTDVLLPGLRQIIMLIFASKSGPTSGEIPEGWAVEMNPVRKATPMETGELAARQAQADSAYISAGVYTADEAAVSRFTPAGLSFETHIDPEPRRLRLLAARAAALTIEPAASTDHDPAPAPEAPPAGPPTLDVPGPGPARLDGGRTGHESEGEGE